MDNPFEVLNQKVDRLEALLTQALTKTPTSAMAPVGQEPAITLEEAAKVLGLSRSALYQNLDKVAHHKRFGRLYFYESELHGYIRSSPESVRT